MIRNLSIALALVLCVTMETNAQSAPIISMQDEAKCFVCGRTSNDFNHLHDKALQGYDEQIRQLSGKISDIEQQNTVRYSIITKATRNNPNMALAVDTVMTDVETFSKIIPTLDEILDFYKKYGEELGLRSNAHLRLSDLVVAMKSPALPEMLKAKQELETVEAKRKGYQQVKDNVLDFSLFRVTAKLSTISTVLATIEDRKKQYNSRLGVLLSQARSAYKDTKNPRPLWDIIEQFKQRIYADNSIQEHVKADLYQSLVAELLDFPEIEYSLYLCPVCLSLLKNGVSNYRIWRFDKNANRWDTTLINLQ